MPSAKVGLEASEIARIRAEYRRRSVEVPADYYSGSRPENHFPHARLTLACIAALRSEGRFPLGDQSIADVGCGLGARLLQFAQ